MAAAHKQTIKLGIKRDNDHMYFVKEGAVWSAPRKKPGVKAKGRQKKIQQFGTKKDMDYKHYLYYVDGKGNVVMTPRKKRKAKAAKKRK